MGQIKTFQLKMNPIDSSSRTIYIYLPNTYNPKRKKPYPVLYMFDGHNLFLDETATYGKSWGIKEYLDQENLDLVVIGQECNHEGNMRLSEYSPYYISKTKWFTEVEPLGHLTAKWFVETLKPYCEKKYNIYKTRDHIGIGGSSMGGLMSLYCISQYNHVFSKAACVSSAIKPVIKDLLKDIEKSKMNPHTKIYMDFGSKEVSSKEQLEKNIDYLLQVNHLFQLKGCETYPHLVIGGSHSEASWEEVVPLFIDYLYPELR